MKHNEPFMIYIRQGYNEHKNKQEVQYEVKKILSIKDKWYAIKEIIFSLGSVLLIDDFREIALEKYDLHMVEMMYDDKKTAMRHIRSYNNGLYDNSLY